MIFFTKNPNLNFFFFFFFFFGGGGLEVGGGARVSYCFTKNPNQK